MFYRWLCCFVISIVLLTPSFAQAQDDVDLIVTLRDVSGLGIANVQITVRDRTGEQEFARAATNDNGVATIQGLVVSDIRIVVNGMLPGGQSLQLRGDDVRGIRVFLGVGATQIDLRVENDGTVITDPSEIAQEGIQGEGYIPPVIVGEAVGVVVMPSLPAQVPTVPIKTVDSYQPDTDASQDSRSWPLLLIAVLGGLIAAVVVVGRRV